MRRTGRLPQRLIALRHVRPHPRTPPRPWPGILAHLSHAGPSACDGVKPPASDLVAAYTSKTSFADLGVAVLAFDLFVEILSLRFRIEQHSVHVSRDIEIPICLAAGKQDVELTSFVVVFDASHRGRFNGQHAARSRILRAVSSVASGSVQCPLNFTSVDHLAHQSSQASAL